MFFSIVIPVYNVKKYLSRCVNSVLSQEYTDFEIILVDDGSTDGSGELCDTFKGLDHRIKVLHKENAGLSDTRNKGIKVAEGEYIILLDSDDSLVENSLKKIRDAMIDTNCDVYSGFAYSIKEDQKKIEKGRLKKFPQKVITGSEYIRLLDKQRKEVTFCAPFMIYKRSFLNSSNLVFRESLLHEDELWTPEVLLKCNSIMWMNIPYYNHYVRQGSIMNSSNYEKKAKSMVTICKSLESQYNKQKGSDVRYLKDRMVMVYLSIVPYLDDPRDYKKAMGRFFTVKNAKHLDTRLKAFLFVLTARGYKTIHSLACH